MTSWHLMTCRAAAWILVAASCAAASAQFPQSVLYANGRGFSRVEQLTSGGVLANKIATAFNSVAPLRNGAAATSDSNKSIASKSKSVTATADKSLDAATARQQYEQQRNIAIQLLSQTERLVNWRPQGPGVPAMRQSVAVNEGPAAAAGAASGTFDLDPNNVWMRRPDGTFVQIEIVPDPNNVWLNRPGTTPPANSDGNVWERRPNGAAGQAGSPPVAVPSPTGTSDGNLWQKRPQ